VNFSKYKEKMKENDPTRRTCLNKLPQYTVNASGVRMQSDYIGKETRWMVGGGEEAELRRDQGSILISFSFTLKMEATYSSEMLESTYKTT
jgi:hypothetical protein